MRAWHKFKLYKSILNHSSAYDITQTLAESSHNISISLPPSKTCTLLKEAAVLIYLIFTPLFSFSHSSLSPLHYFYKLASLSLTQHDVTEFTFAHWTSKFTKWLTFHVHERLFRSNWLYSHHIDIALWRISLCLFAFYISITLSSVGPCFLIHFINSLSHLVICIHTYQLLKNKQHGKQKTLKWDSFTTKIKDIAAFLILMF